MFVRHLPWVVVAVVAFWNSFAAARTWDFKEGPLEGELIDVDRQIVQIQRPNGETVQYHQSVLSRADRKFVDEWLSAEAESSSGDELQVIAKPYCETIRFVGNDIPPRSVLVVLVKVRGKDAATATYYRDLQVDEAVADNGTALKMSAQTMGHDGKSIALARYEKIEQPPWGFKFKLIFDSPDRAISAIRRLSGSMRIVTGKPQSMTIAGLGATKNRRLSESLFQQVGLTVTENPSPRSAGIFYEGQEKQTQFVLQIEGSMQRVFSVELLDAKGELVKNFSGRSATGFVLEDKVSGTTSESKTYQFELRSPAPTDLRMRVTVLKDAHEVRVPFTFTDLAIPWREPPAQPKK